MNRKRISIYILTIMLIMYQTGMSMPVKVLAVSTNSMTTIVYNGENGVYQAEIQYDDWMKQYPKCVHGVNEWKKVDGKYKYPVTPYDEEWGNYMLSAEKYTACQIPQEILDSLSTGELLELVLDYPLLVNMCLYDSMEDGVKKLAQYFNGMDELLLREDCLKVVSSYYKEYKIPKKQQLDYDELLPGDNPDYYIIVNDEELMRKAEEDANVMNTLNLCEAIIEIAVDKDKISMQEKQVLTGIIIKKQMEKMSSECVEGISTEIDQEDSILNQYKNKSGLFSTSKLNVLKNSNKNANKSNENPYYLLGKEKVFYAIVKKSKKISDATISDILSQYKQYHYANNSGKEVVTVAGEGGTTAYNCYNFAWLKKYDPKNLWKKCTLDNDNAYRHYKNFTKKNSPSGAGWVGSNAVHAVYTVKENVEYVNDKHQPYSAPMVKSKWGANGPLLQHPLNLGEYAAETNSMTWYC